MSSFTPGELVKGKFDIILVLLWIIHFFFINHRYFLTLKHCLSFIIFPVRNINFSSYVFSVYYDESFLGTAFVNPKSNIFARLFSTKEVSRLDTSFFASRFQLAANSMNCFQIPYAYLWYMYVSCVVHVHVCELVLCMCMC